MCASANFGCKPPSSADASAEKRELPAKVKVNGQPVTTADFSPAAQAQIAQAIAADDPDASAEKRKAEYAATEPNDRDDELPSIKEESFHVIDKCLKAVKRCVDDAVIYFTLQAVDVDVEAVELLFDQLEGSIALQRSEAKRKAADAKEKAAA